MACICFIALQAPLAGDFMDLLIAWRAHMVFSAFFALFQ